MTSLTGKQWHRIIVRDEGRCYHCGTTERLVPNHRMNRGAGGSKALEIPANVVTLCSFYNGEIEANAEAASQALACGWKIGGHPVVTKFVIEDIMRKPVFDNATGQWFRLDNEYRRTPVLDWPVV